jgi:hypothetical protein
VTCSSSYIKELYLLLDEELQACRDCSMNVFYAFSSINIIRAYVSCNSLI